MIYIWSVAETGLFYIVAKILMSLEVNDPLCCINIVELSFLYNKEPLFELREELSFEITFKLYLFIFIYIKLEYYSNSIDPTD